MRHGWRDADTSRTYRGATLGTHNHRLFRKKMPLSDCLYFRFPAAFPAFDAAPKGVDAGMSFAFVFSCFGFFFSRFPLLIVAPY
jgi:hypothetical protein